MLASGSDDTSIGIWNPFNYTRVAQIQYAHEEGVRCVKWLGTNSGYLASAGDDSIINIWEIGTFRFVKRLRGHSNSVTCLDVLSSGALVSGSLDKYVRVWDLDTAQIVNSYFNPSTVQNIKQISDEILAVVGSNIRVFLVNFTTMSVVNNTVGAIGTNLRDIILLDNSTIFATSWNQSISLLNASSYQTIKTYQIQYKINCLESVLNGNQWFIKFFLSIITEWS